MVETPEMLFWLAAWLACAAFVIEGQRRLGNGTGLVISYVLQLWVLHWLGVAIYILPWYWHADLALWYGLRESTYAVAGFAVGSTILVPFIMRKRGQGADGPPR